MASLPAPDDMRKWTEHESLQECHEGSNEKDAPGPGRGQCWQDRRRETNAVGTCGSLDQYVGVPGT